MRRQGLDKLYDRLTPEERFRLDVEAMARGDEEESRELTHTCPRRNYTMNDVGFAGRWDGAIQMSMVVLLDLGPVIARLRMIEAFRVLLPYCRTLAQNDAHSAYFDGHEAGSRRRRSPASPVRRGRHRRVATRRNAGAPLERCGPGSRYVADKPRAVEWRVRYAQDAS